MWTAENRPRYNRDKLRYPNCTSFSYKATIIIVPLAGHVACFIIQTVPAGLGRHTLQAHCRIKSPEWRGLDLKVGPRPNRFYKEDNPSTQKLTCRRT
jgi:hypothetical protein